MSGNHPSVISPPSSTENMTIHCISTVHIKVTDYQVVTDSVSMKL